MSRTLNRRLLEVLGVVVALCAGGLAFVLVNQNRQPVVAASPATTSTTSTGTSTSTSTSTSLAPPVTAAPPASASFADVYRKVHAGVVRVDTEGCGSLGVGTGFLVSPSMAVTAAHVVAGSSSLFLSTTTGESSQGRVVGHNDRRDLALVRLEKRFSGHTFDFVKDTPDVGDPVALIGYPLGAPLSLATGAVSGLDRSVETESGVLGELIQTDVAANPGNSGGPLVNDDGEVIGVLVGGYVDAAGLAYAVSAEAASSEVSRWLANPQPRVFDECGDAGTAPGEGIDAGDASQVNILTSHPDVEGLAAAFETYVNGINTGGYESAYGVLAGGSRERTSYPEFAEANSTSYILDFTIHSVEDVSPTINRVRATFFSYQDPAYGPEGQDCSEWDITYTTELMSGLWYVTGASNNGSSPTQCLGD